jgi:hypothetical protein
MTMSRGEIENVVGRELSPGERLLWTGVPRQGLLLRPSDALMVPFSLLWGGFAIFWETSVLAMGGPVFFAIWGVPFVLVGLYMIVGRFFVDARVRARTVYVLTDRRAIVVSGPFSPTVRSVDLARIPEVSIAERVNGTGTITFGSPAIGAAWFGGMPWPGVAGKFPPAFELVAEVRTVYQRVREAQAAAVAAAR